MKYNGTIYRPPREASTFLIPITEGCTHNGCRFCNMFKDVRFRMVPLEDVEEFLRAGGGIAALDGLEVPPAVHRPGEGPFETRPARRPRGGKENQDGLHAARGRGKGSAAGGNEGEQAVADLA